MARLHVAALYCAFPLEHAQAYSVATERFPPSQFFVRTRLALATSTIGAACADTGIRRSIRKLKWPIRHIPKRQNITKPQQNRIGKPRNNTARTTMRRARSIHRKPSCIPRVRASIPRRPTARVPKPSSSRFPSRGRPQRRLFDGSAHFDISAPSPLISSSISLRPLKRGSRPA